MMLNKWEVGGGVGYEYERFFWDVIIVNVIIVCIYCKVLKGGM